MPREKNNVPTRQLYAQIREDLYLGAKSRAAEMRVPMREFIERAIASRAGRRRADGGNGDSALGVGTTSTCPCRRGSRSARRWN